MNPLSIAREDLQNFCNYLINVGDGKLKTDSTGAITIPDCFLLPPNDSNGLLKWVYGDRPRSLPEENSCVSQVYKSILDENVKYYLSFKDIVKIPDNIFETEV